MRPPGVMAYARAMAARVARPAPVSSPRSASVPTACAGLLTGLLLLSSCAAAPDGGTEEEPSTAAPSSGASSGSSSDTSSAQAAEQFTVFAAGDVLPHGNVLATAQTDGGAYDFSPMMAEMQDWVSGADLALCGMEVPVAPQGQEPIGYPVFGAPASLVSDLADLGFDGCSTATNHSMDQGIAGLERTLDVFDEQGLGHVGTARSAEEAAAPQTYTLERGGQEVTVAHLSATRIRNGAHELPQGRDWALDESSPEELTARARAAREAGADVVLASVHWGEEYTDGPTAAQRSYGEELAAGGEIDVVLGSHSHTPQPIEVLDGGPDGEGMQTVWSMGNFLTNQDEECCVQATATGAAVLTTITVPEDGDPQVTAMDWTPVTADRGPHDEGSHRGIWPLDELVADGVPEQLQLGEERVRARLEGIVEVMGEQRHRTAPPEPTGPEPAVEPRP
ncbi:hypothetical protein GCM10020260_13840 [Nesterenkonia halobia]|uniref:Capsule synthesis protein CapA domain-containing protein n=2 Tax=Nesterenkonia halobia TaxID=37922 RepID=A0ABP6RDU1_9MICC